MIKLGEIAEWILANRRDKAFVRYTLAEILDELKRCSDDRTMVVMTDDNECIVGVATGKVSVDRDKLFVYNVLTTKPKVARRMIQWLQTNFPGHTLEGMVRGTRFMQFVNLNKLANRL